MTTTLSKLLPSAEALDRAADVATTLARRRTTSGIAAATAVLAAAIQVTVEFLQVDGLRESLGTLVDGAPDWRARLRPADVVMWSIVFAAVATWLTLRWTGALLKETRAPFRYTLSIAPFRVVEWLPNTASQIQGRERLDLLHLDLTQQLCSRIRRFEVLEDPGEPPDAAPRALPSHVGVSGYIVVRQNAADRLVLEVVPRIRLGAASASPGDTVEFELPPAGESSDAGALLSGQSYTQLLERLQSRVTTAIYARIDDDVRAKINLFPTRQLRSTALFHEAEDMFRSNTVDAYDRAIALYRLALEALGFWELPALTKMALWPPAVLWRFELRHHIRRGRILAGLGKCTVFRNILLAFSAREQRTPVYVVRDDLSSTYLDLQNLHRRIADQRTPRARRGIAAVLRHSHDTWLDRLTGKISRDTHDTLRANLWDLHLVESMTSVLCGEPQRAEAALAAAADLAPERIRSDPLYLVAQGLAARTPAAALANYQRAREIAPRFLIATALHAMACDREFRERGELTPERVRRPLEAYEGLLRLNYGAISALSAQGYLQWVMRDPSAESKLREAMAIKSLVGDTYTAELSYRLARIAAEKGEFDECARLYEEAVAAEPGIATNFEWLQAAPDFSHIGDQMLLRVEQYAEPALTSLRALRRGTSSATGTSKDLAKRTRLAHAFVANDYGNACVNFFALTGNHALLQRAIARYREATEVAPDDARPWFNLGQAYRQSGAWAEANKSLERARSLSPGWPRLAAYAATRKADVRLFEARRSREEAAREEQRVRATENVVDELRLRRTLLEQRLRTAAVASTPVAQLFSLAPEGFSQQVPEPSALGGNGAGGAATANTTVLAELRAALQRAAGGGPATEDALLARIGANLGRPLRSPECELIRAAAMRPVISQALVQRATIEAEMTKELEALRAEEEWWREDLERSTKASSDRRSRAERAENELHRGVEEAIAQVKQATRYPKFFEGPPDQWVKKLRGVLWANFDSTDVDAMGLLVEVLATSTRPDYLSAALELSDYIRPAAGSFQLYLQRRALTALIELLEKEPAPRNGRWLPSWVRRGSRTPLAHLREKQRECEADWRDHLDRMIESRPDDFGALLWLTSERTENASAVLEDFRARFFAQNDELFEARRGCLEYHFGRWDDAADAFARAEQINPGAAVHAYHRGLALRRAGNLDEARTALQSAHEREPLNAEYALELASTYHERAQALFLPTFIADARDALEQATLLAPQVAAYHAELARAYDGPELPGRERLPQRALESLRRALQLEPENPEYRSRLRELERRVEALGTLAGDLARTGELFPAHRSPILVKCAHDLVDEIVAPTHQDLDATFGVPLRGVNIVRDDAASEGAYTISVDGVPVARGQVSPGRVLCTMQAEELRERAIPGEPTVDPLTGLPSTWIERAAASPLPPEFIFGPADYCSRHLHSVVRKNLARLIDREGVRDLIATVEDADRDDDSSRPRFGGDHVAVGRITATIRALLEEEVPVVDLASLLVFAAERSGGTYEELVARMRALPQTRARLPANARRMPVYKLSDEVERTLFEARVQRERASFLLLDPAYCQDFLVSLARTVEPSTPEFALMVGHDEIRAHVRDLIAGQFPNGFVVSRAEFDRTDIAGTFQVVRSGGPS